jgi:Flp pilus assembly protein TadD
VTAWITACSAYRDLGEGDQAIAVLKEAAERDPNQFDIRRALGANLLMQERYAEAAEHLKWAAMRRPSDAGLRQAAEQAIRESHRTAGLRSEGILPTGLQQSWGETAPVQNANWPPTTPR